MREVVLDSMAVAKKAIRLVELEEAVALIGTCRDVLDALEASMLAESGGSARNIETVVSAGKRTSKASAKRRTGRAEVVRENPQLAKELAEGRLASGHVDAIAAASRKTDGAAARDAQLHTEIAVVNPDQARSIADEYVRRHQTQDQIQSEHERGRRRRCIRRSRGEDTDTLHVEGARADIDQLEGAIRRRADALYTVDGGRDVPNDKHPRTRQQRRFDALMELTTTDGGDQCRHTGGRSATFFITATIDQLTGADQTPMEWIGSGPLPRSMFEYLACDAEFIGIIFDQVGEVLWQGRSVRNATPAQYRALVARDKGCTVCGAHHDDCHAHHLIPWTAKLAGLTDIENLALVCIDCHRRIHEERLTLYRDEHGRWNLRPATDDEIAAAAPPGSRERQRRPGPDTRSRPPTKPTTLAEQRRTLSPW